MAITASAGSVPTRDEWRRVSRWAWLLIGLAVAAAIVDILASDSITLSAVVNAVIGTTALLGAAALVAVAPRQRLVALSALGFAVVPVLQLIRLVFSRDIHDLLRMPQPTYVDFSGVVLSTLDLIGGLGWLFSLGAVLCLAFYIGTVRTQRGWWIVGIGLVLAAVQVAINVVNLLPILSMFADAPPDSGFNPAQQVAGILLGALVLVAWAYLAAVALERGLTLLAAAAGIRLLEMAVGLVAGAVVQAFPPNTSDGADAVNFMYVGFFFIANLAFWATFIIAILRELPKGPTNATLDLSSPEVTVSAG